MKNLYLLLTFLALSISTSADNLASGVKITMIGNTPDGSKSFFIRTSGGSGPCTNGTVIVFPLSLSQDEATHNRAFSLALTAYTTGSTKVKISTFTNGDSNCRRAAYIDLSS
ncbi:MAG: DUF5992 family protein [Cellvibrionaceae bacterium]